MGYLDRYGDESAWQGPTREPGFAPLDYAPGPLAIADMGSCWVHDWVDSPDEKAKG